MEFDIIKAVCDWNRDRNNTYFDHIDEFLMLDEELMEYFESHRDYDQADALADLIFVAIGSLFKLTGGDEQKVYDILAAVSAANELKGKEKNENGKVIKPADFQGPEEIIKRVLSDANQELQEERQDG